MSPTPPPPWHGPPLLPHTPHLPLPLKPPQIPTEGGGKTHMVPHPHPQEMGTLPWTSLSASLATTPSTHPHTAQRGNIPSPWDCGEEGEARASCSRLGLYMHTQHVLLSLSHSLLCQTLRWKGSPGWWGTQRHHKKRSS